MARRSEPPDARGTLRPGGGHRPMPRRAIEQTLAAAIERQVEAGPQRLAIRMDGVDLTYERLGALADLVAAGLAEDGVGAGSRADGLPPIVAVAATQSIELIVGIVGILKAGAAYLPVDPAGGLEPAEALLERAGVAALVADRASRDHAARLERPSRPHIEVPPPDTDPDATVRLPVRRDDPRTVACVYPTSGSTGAPKLVTDSHRNLLHNVRRYTNSLLIGPEDRLSLVQSSTFSGAVSSLFGALVNGAAILPYDVRRQGAAGLGGWVRDERLTMFHAVPVLFRALCAAGTRYDDIRVVRLEGDAAAWSDVAAFRAHFGPGAVLVNGLGTTETGLVRQFFVDHDTPLGTGGLPLGYPVPDVDVRIVGEDGRSVGVGQPGLVEVLGEFLALGYLGEPERTAGAFRPAGSAGRRRYQTGDLGRFDPGGVMTGLGRADFAEKINGEWVDLPEVERLLRAQPGVRDAVAVTRRDGGAAARLVAYVTGDSDGDGPRPEALRRALLEVLPRSSVPSAIVVLEALPLDTSAKVDRARLPSPGDERPDLAVAYESPRTPREAQIAGLWGDILGVRPVGIHDDFFDLGGDSLDAAMLATALVERGLADAPDDAIAAASTVARLAATLDEASLPTIGAGSEGRDEGHRVTWFAVPGDRFNPTFFARVQRSMTDGLTLSAVAPSGRPDDPIDIAADARVIADDIDLGPRAGPIYLAGDCFGAVTALEVAHELRARGRSVGGVALLGITPLEFPGLIDRRELRPRIVRFRRWARSNTRRALAAGGPSEIASHLARHVAWLGTRARRATGRWIVRRGMADASSAATLLDRRLLAIGQRPARPFDGKVAVILGTQSAHSYARWPERAWRHLGRDVSVVLLPGTDQDMLVDPGAPRLAAALEAFVRDGPASEGAAQGGNGERPT